MGILLFSEDAMMEVLRDRLLQRDASLNVVCVHSPQEACQQLQREDVRWELVAIFHPEVGGLSILEQIAARKLTPRLGALCGFRTGEKHDLGQRISGLGGIPVLNIKLLAECERLVFSR